MAAPPPAGIAGDEVDGGLGWQFDHSQRIAPVTANPVGLAIGPRKRSVPPRASYCCPSRQGQSLGMSSLSFSGGAEDRKRVLLRQIL